MENRVLFVDDELHILKAIKRGLHREKYTKFFASSGKEALEIIEENDIHVIVSDMKMPEMNGLELLTIIKEKYPDMVKIILSGYTQLQQIIVTINRIDIYKFITKPWDMEVEFKEVIQSAIDLYNTRIENKQLKVSIIKKNELYQNMLKSNNAKMVLMKNDFGFLETLNKVLVNYYYMMGMKLKKGEISDVSYQQELSFLNYLYTRVVKLMPTVHSDFNIKNMEEHITKYIRQNSSQSQSPSQVAITSGSKSKGYRGDFNILMFTIESLITYFFNNEISDIYSIAITEKESGYHEGVNGNSNVELLLLIKSESNSIVFDKMRIDSINLFFSNLIESYHGHYSVEKKGEENLILMKFPVSIT